MCPEISPEEEARTLSERTFPEWLKAQALIRAEEAVFFSEQPHSPEWQPHSYHEFYGMVEACAAGLTALGVRKGDVVAFLAANCIEWEVIHHACLCIGAIVLGIDCSAPGDSRLAMLEASQAAYLVTDSLQHIQGLPLESLPVEAIILLGTSGSSASPQTRVIPFQDLVTLSAERGYSEVDPEDPALLIFTSGTTGKSKGILYTHEQLLMAMHALREHFIELEDIPLEDRSVLCWMPLANLFQRILNLLVLSVNGKIYYTDDPKKLQTLLTQIQPGIFVGVPRVFERIAGSALRFIQKWPAALQPHVTQYLVGPMVKRKMGNRIKFLASGSAKAAGRTLDFFEDIGWPIYEVYGMSENIIPMAGNNRDVYRKGSVGKPLRYNDIIVRNDEICLRSPGIGARLASGAESDRSREGTEYFPTGDLGSIDPDGFVYVRGRKDDVIKTSTGIRILCNPLEEMLAASIGVEQVLVCGQGRKLLTAIVVSDREPSELAQLLERLNRELPERHRIYGALLLGTPFTPETGYMTPNLKIRRTFIESSFSNKLDELYDHFEESRSIVTPVVHRI